MHLQKELASVDGPINPASVSPVAIYFPIIDCARNLSRQAAARSERHVLVLQLWGRGGLLEIISEWRVSRAARGAGNHPAPHPEHSRSKAIAIFDQENRRATVTGLAGRQRRRPSAVGSHQCLQNCAAIEVVIIYKFGNRLRALGGLDQTETRVQHQHRTAAPGSTVPRVIRQALRW